LRFKSLGVNGKKKMNLLENNMKEKIK
jgi:hypothetical protein